MSEAKVCEVCGRRVGDRSDSETCGAMTEAISDGSGCQQQQAECYRRGYERERAAREKAEAERDAAIEARESAMDDTAVALRQAKNAEADLARARKDLAEAQGMAVEEFAKWLRAQHGREQAEAARDEAIRLLRVARGAPCDPEWDRNAPALADRIYAFLRAHDATANTLGGRQEAPGRAESGPSSADENNRPATAARPSDSAATGDTPSNPGAGRLSGSVAPAVPATGRSSEEMRGGVSTSDKPFAAIIDSKPEPAGRSEAEALALSLGLADRLPQKYHRADGTVVDASGNPWRSTLVEQIRAALAAARHDGMMEAIEAAIQAHVGNRCGPYSTCPVCGFADAAERRGMERAADGCDHYAETAKVAGDLEAAAVATVLARSIRARAAELEKKP